MAHGHDTKSHSAPVHCTLFPSLYIFHSAIIMQRQCSIRFLSSSPMPLGRAPKKANAWLTYFSLEKFSQLETVFFSLYLFLFKNLQFGPVGFSPYDDCLRYRWSAVCAHCSFFSSQFFFFCILVFQNRHKQWALVTAFTIHISLSGISDSHLISIYCVAAVFGRWWFRCFFY